MMTLIRPLTFDYAERRGGALGMDLYHPGGGVRPLVLFAYGGGFTKGSKDANVHQPLVQHLCSAGFAVAVPDYRLKTGAGDVAPDDLIQITRLANPGGQTGLGAEAPPV
ncbi:alpha/beta hydrolase [Tateyamaria armeniaca]|uniref:Alpha/beta hydrolase n=1 Tax=Tateyamaria armeniaca TaxID=2518930 RepID=A0ABW8UZB8_9RHOB